MRNHRLGTRGTRLKLTSRRALSNESSTFSEQRRFQRINIIRECISRFVHTWIGSHCSVVAHATSSLNVPRPPSACQLRPPGSLRISPIDAFKHIRQLRRGYRNHSVCRRRPHEATAFQSLGIERHAEPVMPENLQKVTTARFIVHPPLRFPEAGLPYRIDSPRIF